MRTTVRLPLLALLGTCLLGEATAQAVNLGFDDHPPRPGAPEGWDSPDARPPSGGEGYEADTVADAQAGRAAARLRFVGPGREEAPDFGTFTQAVDATPWRGRRVRLSGWLRTEDVDFGAGLWLRVDGEHGLLAFDNMSDRFVTGDAHWAPHAVVHDIDPAADELVFGVLLTGPGTVWADSLTLEAVGDDVEPTTLVADEPFDDEPADEHVVDWIRRHAVPVETNLSRDIARALPSGAGAPSGRSDLRPFVRTLDARVIGLGEGSLGTREQHRLRQRLVQALVEEHGVDVVALDIDWAASLYLDQWVRRGRGDPRAELAALPDWSWRYEEVLDLLRWLRAWNREADGDERVQLTGVNARRLGPVLPLAVSYLERVAGDEATTLESVLEPLTEAEARKHRAADDELERAAYAIEHVLGLFDAQREPWSASTSPRAWERARHLVQVAGHAVALQQARAESPWVDVRARADNVQWLLEQLEDPDGRVLVLAHNHDVALRGELEFPTLGQELAARLGSDYVGIGGVFGRGSFRARDGRTMELRAFEVGPPEAGSVGETLGRAHADFPFLLDLRAAPPAGPVNRWLERPHRMRSVGPWYSEHAAGLFDRPRRLDEAFHALIFTPETTLATPLGEP